jgi:hypothetical protein
MRAEVNAEWELGIPPVWKRFAQRILLARKEALMNLKSWQSAMVRKAAARDMGKLLIAVA